MLYYFLFRISIIDTKNTMLSTNINKNEINIKINDRKRKPMKQNGNK